MSTITFTHLFNKNISLYSKHKKLFRILSVNIKNFIIMYHLKFKEIL
jgi:hypothetical protein